ncbi:MAG: class I SAM-dependent methyltransferase [Acidobacteria bacterium]|jgi:SAM-dependent methyltransferase|nr:class I SAM-dependent methyltransferase [Acidobacteriota bacterium]
MKRYISFFHWFRRYLGNGSIRKYLYEKIKAKPPFYLRYLKLAILLSNHGITPPLTMNADKHEAMWRNQGTPKSSIRAENYTVYNDSIEKLFQDVLPLLTPESNILEIGCNAGRNLNYLFNKGFRNLTGIEIGTYALELFEKTFPGAFRSTNIIAGNAAEEIKKLESNFYDLVFTHSVLVNIAARHNHIFREMCRVCRGYILTLESEGHLRAFPRDFRRIFEKNDFAQVAYRWMVWGNDGKLTFPLPVKGECVLKNNTIRLFAPCKKSNK